MKTRLRELRWGAMLTQAELARKSGIPAPVINAIESGKTKNPRIDTISAIARVLGTTVDELIGGDSNETVHRSTDG